jgi:hypothetical protein
VLGNLLGKIFGTEKALSSVIDGVSSGIDKLIYTDQEKSEDAAKDRAAARSMIIAWMETTKGQNLARRLIALSIVFVWLSLYLVSMGLSVSAIWVAGSSSEIIKSAQIIGDFGERMNGAVMLILAFYFAAPHMGSMVRGALDKFGKTNK